MTNFRTPGVYIQEVSTFPASIAPVATAIPGFIGYTDKASDDGVSRSLVLKAKKISSFVDFEEWYGTPAIEDIDVTIDDIDPENIVITSEMATNTSGTSKMTRSSHFLLSNAVRMYFANGGGDCYIVSVGLYGEDTEDDQDYNGTVAYNDLKAGLEVAGTVDEITLNVIPEAQFLSASTFAQYGTLMVDSITQCNELQDRFAIMDVPFTVDPDGSPSTIGSGIGTDASTFRTVVSGTTDFLKYGAGYYPNIEATFAYNYTDDSVAVNYTGGGSPTTLAALKNESGGNQEQYNAVVAHLSTNWVHLPPSSAMAGIYARTDRTRGVWKAPANESVNAITGPLINISAAQQADLNVDATSGKSINAIRPFTGRGTLVWGARTLAGNDNEWRYVPVRRLFNFVEESTKKATEFVVFEPNDANTWLRVKTMISSFLSNIWRDGALAGATPEAAYFVNVGIGETMTAQDILEGRMIVEIGMAAVRPAEFIILRFSHKLQES